MKTIVVLGMHRSATSLIAKGLQNEIHMGKDLLEEMSSNPLGHFEDKRFLGMNQFLLKKAGGSWRQPPSEEAILQAGEEHRNRIQKLVREAGEGREIWGWKEPRTTLTIRCYLPFLENPHFIACFREPHEVARSLKERDGIPIGRGISLTREYNRRLFKFLKEFTCQTQ